MARILANMLDGGSEETLFFGGAGQFIELMAKVRCAGASHTVVCCGLLPCLRLAALGGC